MKKDELIKENNRLKEISVTQQTVIRKKDSEIEDIVETELAEEIPDIDVALQELAPSSASSSEAEPCMMGDFVVAVVKMVIAVALMTLIFSGHCQ